jgi:hypothetical protein
MACGWRFPTGWLVAAVCGLGAVALWLAGASAATGVPANRFTFDPAIKVESRIIGPSQQFETRLRLVLPHNVHGYSVGFRRIVEPGEASLAHFLRISARLPGRKTSPRPYLEFSIISRSR